MGCAGMLERGRMGTATALAPGLSRKLRKVLDSHRCPDLLASLNTLSSFYSENTRHGRQNLRFNIEKRGLSINEEFLAASTSAQQRAGGLELLDMMAVYQDGAYERLCRWVQAECRGLGDVDNPEVSELLQTAVSCLKARPVLFKYCAEEVANMRHNALFRRFISALTHGGHGGLPRPIWVHAHDLLRYALASERELVLALLNPDSVVDTGSIAQRLSKVPEKDVGKTESDLTFVLDRIFEGVCRPFKVRVEEVLQSQPNLIILYKLRYQIC